MYAITHQEHTDAYNKALEAQELDWLKTHPDKVVLYIGTRVSTLRGDGPFWEVKTWPGTVLDNFAAVGPRRNVGFGYHTYRRSVSCKIFGVQYHGWYMESSGDYCRLRKAKHN